MGDVMNTITVMVDGKRYVTLDTYAETRGYDDTRLRALRRHVRKHEKQCNAIKWGTRWVIPDDMSEPSFDGIGSRSVHDGTRFVIYVHGDDKHVAETLHTLGTMDIDVVDPRERAKQRRDARKRAKMGGAQ